MKELFNKEFYLSLFVFLFLIIITVGSFYQNKPPKVVPKDSPADIFSAERAMAYLPDISANPHAIGTKEHSKVRDYLIDLLKSMGTDPELQKTEVFYPYSYKAATIGNIIVRLPGTKNTKSVLIMGHYDSVEDSYGASDDGSAVVTMIETLRVLKAQGPLNNDIVFLFTDGEEAGLLGARAFIEQHPMAKDIGIVLNFEASGTSGQSLMFETSQDNKWLISEFAKAAPYPAANSLNYEIYRNMPNSTDLTPFKISGFRCLNFAFIESRYDYHTLGDNIRNTSASSVQHHGSYATALARHFGNIDLNNSEKGDAVYFNTLGNGFVYYSYKLILPFIILTALFLILVLVIGYKKKIIKPFRLLLGFFAFLFNLLLAPAVVTCITFVLAKYYPGTDSRLLYYNYTYLLLAFVCISVAISFVFYRLLGRGIKIWHVSAMLILILMVLFWSGKISLLLSIISVAYSAIMYLLFRKPTGVWDLSLGAAVGWAVLMISVSIMLPGVSYLFTWPLLLSLIPTVIFFISRSQIKYSPLHIALFLGFSIPAITWFSNLTYLFLVAMGLNLAGGAILISVLCMSLLIPHIDMIMRNRSWIFAVVTILAGLLFLFKGSVGLKYDDRYKKSNSIIYAVNGNTKETFWTSFELMTDEWTAKFLSVKPDTGKMDEFFPFERRDFLKKRIEPGIVPVPDITVLKDSISGKERFLKLHIGSGRRTNNMDIILKTESKVVKASLNRSSMAILPGYRGTSMQYIRYYAFPPGGIDIKLELESEKKIEVELIDIVFGMPDFPGITTEQRPDYMMSRGDRSLIANSFFY